MCDWRPGRLVLSCWLLLSVAASACLADLGLDKAALLKKYGEPEKSAIPPLAGCWDEVLVFPKGELLIQVYVKNGKACSVVYGHNKAGQPISQTDILLLLNLSTAGGTWQPQTITDVGVINFARSDGKAFASYDGNDAKPCLNVMTEELWGKMNARKKKAATETGGAPAAKPPAPRK